MQKAFIVIAVALSLSACGGGGSSTSAPSLAPAISQALANIGPVSQPSAMVYVNGQQLGYVHGVTYGDVARLAAQTVADNANTYPEAYRALLSASGMPILVKGSGTAQDSNYVAKLGADGRVVVTFVS